MSNRRAQKDGARRARLDREREARPREVRRRRFRYAGAAAAVVLVAGGGVVGAGLGRSSAGGLAKPVDAIRCEGREQVLFHVHSHLAIFVGGRERVAPEGVGIAPPRTAVPTPQGPYVAGGGCFYWLHTHARDGIIHIESPVQRVFTLGDFFDIWGRPLGRDRVGGARGPVTAYVDGRLFPGDPRTIALGAHRVIQLDVGRRVPPRGFSFPPGL